MSVTSKDVARWMYDEVRRRRLLYQCDVVDEIRNDFGEEFTYLNSIGNLAIIKRVLSEFRKLSEDTILWSKSERAWRGRSEYDDPRRQQE